MKLKKTIDFIHRWLGLVSGVVVFIVAITGCLFVFQKEISEAIWKDKFFITPTSLQLLPVSKLDSTAQTALGRNQPINYITVYKEPNRSWEFMAYKENDTALSYFGSVNYFRSVFINPYTGSITGFRDYKYDFFNIVKYLHWSLLLNTKYGQPIVGYSTLIFLILLITGLILWFPKRWNKATRHQAFTIKWKARIKRLNYDLHNVLGFYSLLIVLILTLTGLIWSFVWFEKTVYVVASHSITAPVNKQVKSIPRKLITINPLDIALQTSLKQIPDAKRFIISPAVGSEGVIYVYGYRDAEKYYDDDELQFDQYSGALLQRTNYRDENSGEKIIAMNYDIHVGAVAGITGKIIAFIASLIAACLPITGFFIWLNKRRKTRKKIPKVSYIKN